MSGMDDLDWSWLVIGAIVGAVLLCVAFALAEYGRSAGAKQCVNHPQDSYCQSWKDK